MILKSHEMVRNTFSTGSVGYLNNVGKMAGFE